MLKLKVNDIDIEVEEGLTVLQAWMIHTVHVMSVLLVVWTH